MKNLEACLEILELAIKLLLRGRSQSDEEAAARARLLDDVRIARNHVKEVLRAHYGSVVDR